MRGGASQTHEEPLGKTMKRGLEQDSLWLHRPWQEHNKTQAYHFSRHQLVNESRHQPIRSRNELQESGTSVGSHFSLPVDFV